MSFGIQVKMNDKLYLRDPELSDLGRRILTHAIILIQKDGFEAFTFKKLAQMIGTTEAGIYRYFENKHRLLVYLIAWYWSWLQFNVIFQIQNIQSAELKIKRIISILVLNYDIRLGDELIDIKLLHEVAVSESSKSYLTKHVNDDNKDQLFKPYKDLCAMISEVIIEYNPKYPYSRSLASTLIEMAHFQDFFMHHLPSLTNFEKSNKESLIKFLEHFVFSCIKKTK